MKKIVVMFLAILLCSTLAACGDTSERKNEAPVSDIIAETENTEKVEETDTVAETEPNYAEILPDELQGIWGDTATEGLLALYAFRDNNVETFVVNFGAGASSFLQGTYSIEKNKINYDFGNSSGFSHFAYDNDTLVISNANNVEMNKLSVSDIIEYLTQEESSNNHRGVICLADLIINYYPDSAECRIASEKKDAASAAIKAAGETALQKLNATYDKVEKRTWYQHKNQPKYIDICCYIYPYIGRQDQGETWLRVMLNYTADSWIFFKKVTFSVDGENTFKSFSYSEIVRDNDTEVWEYVDFSPSASDIMLLRSIANSSETIIRFQGDEYHHDHVVTENEKAAILDVLTAYEYLGSLAD